MKLSPKTCLAAVMTSLLTLDIVPFGFPTGLPTQFAVAAEARRPVIIVMEPTFEAGNAKESGVVGAGVAATPLGRYLESIGYVQGKNLFEVGIPGIRDLSGGALQLSVALKEAMRSAQGGLCAECDIIASGLSGLIARYALENGYFSDYRVVNLVMASSPNRGTFLADIVKSVLEIVRQESILEKETRAGRFLPSLKDVFGEPGDSDAKSVKALTQSRALTPPEWADEASWISTRSASLWEPLYAEYVKERYFALPFVPSESPKETYAGWVRRTLPEVWRRLITEAAWPSEDEQDLSLAYYEYLAMEVARNQYVMRTASGGSLVDSLLREPFMPTGWKEAAIHYGFKILQHYAEKALVTVKAEVQELVAHQAVKLTGLGSGPDSPFIAGLVKEDLLINLGTSSSNRFERIPANLSLAGLNKSSQALARGRDTRYVSVCSRLANPWALLWPQLAPNDSLLEVDSSVPPVGDSDLVAVFGGILRLPGKSVLDDRKAQAYIASVLGDSESVPGDERGHTPPQGSLLALEASSWEPRWCSTGAVSRVTVGVTALPGGWQCQVWEEALEQGATGGWKQGLMWAFDAGGNYVVRLSPGTCRLGFRLVRNGPDNPVFGNTVRSAFEQETLVRVFVALAEDEPPGPVGLADDDSYHNSPDSSGDDSSDDGTGAIPGSGTDYSENRDDDEGGDPVGDLPTVRVVYRSKHTTLKKPKETVHGYWTLDYGDGFHEKLEGQPSLTTEHTYETPGQYEVQAQSYTEDGTLLYAKKWDVRVTLSGETRRFACVSIAPVGVKLILNGPDKWVTGKVAVFSAGANLELPPNAELMSVAYDPGQTFGVIWERAGDFVVGCSVSIIVKYLLEDASIEVENTYLREVPVTVLTTGVTQ